MWILGGLISLSPGAAAGEPGSKSEVGRWIPGLAVYSGVILQGAEGALESAPLSSDPSQPVRPSASGDDLMVNPFVGFSAELMTPGLASLPGQPRLFVHGDIVPHFGFERSVAREGAPDEMEDPQLPLRSELAVFGQGSKLDVEMNSPVLAAGLGVAFAVEVWDRQLRIKPSFEYMRERIRASGTVNRAVQLDPGSNRNPRLDSTFRLIEIRGSDVENFHGVGAGLELELDTVRAGPFMLTLFFSNRVYKMLGDLKMEFRGTSPGRIVGGLPASDFPAQGTESASWSFESDPWSYQGGVGLRFRWLPE